MSTKRILAFEADPIYSRMLKEKLGELGYEVEIASDGIEGLDKAASFFPDLIYLCIELPRISGFSICKKLKKSPETKDIPILITSSEVTEQTFERHKKLKDQHADEYLLKPFDGNQIKEVIKKMSSGARDDIDDIMTIDVLDDDAEGLVIEDKEIVEVRNGNDLEEIEDMSDIDDIEIIDDLEDVQDIEKVDEVDELVIEDDTSAPEVKLEDEEIDSEMDAFADEAFASLEMSIDKKMPESEPPEELSEKMIRTDKDSPAAIREKAGAETVEKRALEAKEAELKKAQEEIDRLKKQNEASATRVNTLEKELAEAKTKKGSGVSSREFLDLRELLNKKDRELLDLKDSIMGKEKQLLDARERLTELEGERTEWLEKEEKIEEHLSSMRSSIESLEADKAIIAKKAEDFQSRISYMQIKSDDLEKEIDRLSQEQEGVSAKAKSDLEEAIEKQQVDFEKRKAALIEEADTKLEELRQDLEVEKGAALDQQRLNLEQESAKKMEDALIEQRLRHERELSEIKTRLTEESKQALEDQTKDYDTKVTEIQEEHRLKISDLMDKIVDLELNAATLNDDIEKQRTSFHEEKDALESLLKSAREELETAQDDADEAKRKLEEADTLTASHEKRIEQLKVDIDEAKRKLEEADTLTASHEKRIEQLKVDLEDVNETLAGNDEIVLRTRKALDIAVQLLRGINADE